MKNRIISLFTINWNRLGISYRVSWRRI